MAFLSGIDVDPTGLNLKKSRVFWQRAQGLIRMQQYFLRRNYYVGQVELLAAAGLVAGRIHAWLWRHCCVWLVCLG